jgi:hypothetical protein
MEPVLTFRHVVMLTNEHMLHEQYQLLTNPADIQEVLRHVNRLDLLGDAAILYVVLEGNADFNDALADFLEVWYCGDRHPGLSTAVHLAYRKDDTGTPV